MARPVAIFVVMVLSFQCHIGAGSLSMVLDVVNTVTEITVTLAKAWDFVDQNIDYNDVPLPLLHRTENKLFGRIDRINNRLSELTSRVEEIGTASVTTLLYNLPERIRLELRLNELLDYRGRIDASYQRMEKYTKNDNYERLTLEDFAGNVVSHESSSVINLLERIHRFIVQDGEGISDSGLFNILAKNLMEVEGDMMCNTKQSPQQVLYNLYNAIALTGLKGYTMIQFSYMVLRLHGKGNFSEEVNYSKNRYEERTKEAIEKINNVLKSTRRDYWNCDPKKHIKGETYVEITNLLQGYIQNEVDLNPDGTCRENCAEYTYTKSHGCYQNLYCRQQRTCSGKIINCKFYDSDMWICNANPLSQRRYEYIEFENGRVLGRKQGCSYGTTKVDSWWRWLFWHCSYCFCLCDEQGSMSDRYINMRSAISDIDNNMVVTGLRFVKHNRIIHLQIQEGQLLPKLQINASSVRWKPVEDYKITDRKVFNRQDYHTLSWEQRALDLDDLEADDGYVVTGVRFKEIGSHLNFEIYTTKFDFDSGKLKPDHCSWKDNPNTDAAARKPRSKLFLKSPDIPTRSPNPSLPTSKSDQYIKFTHTDIDRDAAQTTVPFFDAQKVEQLNPVPLTGAGVFHKGRPYFGGFITPKIITFDVSKYLKAAFPNEKDNVIETK